MRSDLGNNETEWRLEVIGMDKCVKPPKKIFEQRQEGTEEVIVVDI
jgi:hypothetical protein